MRGLVRMVQVASDLTIVDLSIRGLSPGTYHATVRETGDISEGPESTGGVWEALKARKDGTATRGVFGTVEVSKGGVGAVFLEAYPNLGDGWTEHGSRETAGRQV